MLAAMQMPEPVPFGRYLLDYKLAAGGMGEVYLARAQGTAGFEKKVVIKRILPHLAESDEFVERFLDEGRLVVQLTHSNIAQVFDMGVADAHYFLAMEYVDGLDMRELLRGLQRADASFAPDLVVFILAEVAKGLAYAHSRTDESGENLGIIHRDVSPSNIMLSRDGEVKLLDFGIAKAASQMAHSVSGSLHGKFLYMSPEQAAGRDLDCRSDLFSLGTCGYEMLTGKRPFQGASELRTLEIIRSGEHVPITEYRDDVPAEVVALIERCLRVDADERFASAGELHRAALAWLVDTRTVVTASDLAAFVRPWDVGRTTTAPPRGQGLDAALNQQLDRLLGEGAVAEGARPSTLLARGDAEGTPVGRPGPMVMVEDPDSALGMRPDTSTGSRRLEDLTQTDVPRASRNRILIASVVLLVGVLVTLNVVTLHSLRERTESEGSPTAASAAVPQSSVPAPGPRDGGEPVPRPVRAPETETASSLPLRIETSVSPVPPSVAVGRAMTLRIPGISEQAVVTIDGQVVAPDEVGRFRVPDGAGPVHLEIRSSDRVPFARTLPRSPGAETVVDEARLEPRRRTVRVRVKPEAATIRVGRRVVGTGSASVLVSAAAPIRGRATLDGYRDKPFIARYAGPKTLVLELAPLELGRFQARIFPVSAAVKVDERRIDRDTAFISQRIAPGPHKLVISSGSKTRAVNFTVRAGQTEKLGQFTLQ